jgi:dolichyl-phosphate-mannose-protein mannosyltransferase
LPNLTVYSHYFPALYFAIIALCQIYDFTFSRFHLGPLRHPVVGQTAAVAFLAVAIFVFTLYAPLVYGNQWTQDECKKVKLFDTWDWDCNTFYPSYEAYENAPASVDSHIPASAAPAGGNPEQPKNDAQVTPQAEVSAAPVAPPADAPQIVGREEKVEYRDEFGNILNDEQVEELKGKVEFQVRPPMVHSISHPLTRRLDSLRDPNTHH